MDKNNNASLIQALVVFNQEMDAWYRSMFQDMSDVSSMHAQSVRSLREEIAAYRKDVSMITLFILQCS